MICGMALATCFSIVLILGRWRSANLFDESKAGNMEVLSKENPRGY